MKNVFAVLFVLVPGTAWSYTEPASDLWTCVWSLYEDDERIAACLREISIAKADLQNPNSATDPEYRAFNLAFPSYSLFDIFLGQENYVRAEEMLANIDFALLNSEDEDTSFILGLKYESEIALWTMLRQDARAEASFRQALDAINDNRMDADLVATMYASKASAQYKVSGIFLALATLELAVKYGRVSDDGRSTLASARGFIFSDEGRYVEAAQAFKTAMFYSEKDGKKYPDHYLYYGEALGKSGEIARGMIEIERNVAPGNFEGKYPAETAASWTKWMQRKLKKEGLYNGDIDGRYGPATRAAWKRCLGIPDCKIFIR